MDGKAGILNGSMYAVVRATPPVTSIPYWCILVSKQKAMTKRRGPHP